MVGDGRDGPVDILMLLNQSAESVYVCVCADPTHLSVIRDQLDLMWLPVVYCKMMLLIHTLLIIQIAIR